MGIICQRKLDMEVKIIIPIIVLVLVYFYLCLSDLIKINNTKLFPKWVWGIICCISIPLGGIIYFIWGRGGLGNENR